MSYLSEICRVRLHYYKYYNNINYFYIIPKPSLLLTVRQLSCIVSEKLALVIVVMVIKYSDDGDWTVLHLLYIRRPMQE